MHKPVRRHGRPLVLALRAQRVNVLLHAVQAARVVAHQARIVAAAEGHVGHHVDGAVAVGALVGRAGPDEEGLKVDKGARAVARANLHHLAKDDARVLEGVAVELAAARLVDQPLVAHRALALQRLDRLVDQVGVLDGAPAAAAAGRRVAQQHVLVAGVAARGLRRRGGRGRGRGRGGGARLLLLLAAAAAAARGVLGAGLGLRALGRHLGGHVEDLRHRGRGLDDLVRALGQRGGREAARQRLVDLALALAGRRVAAGAQVAQPREPALLVALDAGALDDVADRARGRRRGGVPRARVRAGAQPALDVADDARQRHLALAARGAAHRIHAGRQLAEPRPVGRGVARVLHRVAAALRQALAIVDAGAPVRPPRRHAQHVDAEAHARAVHHLEGPRHGRLDDGRRLELALALALAVAVAVAHRGGLDAALAAALEHGNLARQLADGALEHQVDGVARRRCGARPHVAGGRRGRPGRHLQLVLQLGQRRRHDRLVEAHRLARGPGVVGAARFQVDPLRVAGDAHRERNQQRQAAGLGHGIGQRAVEDRVGEQVEHPGVAQLLVDALGRRHEARRNLVAKRLLVLVVGGQEVADQDAALDVVAAERLRKVAGLPRARHVVHDGLEPLHAGSVGLVRNGKAAEARRDDHAVRRARVDGEHHVPDLGVKHRFGHARLLLGLGRDDADVRAEHGVVVAPARLEVVLLQQLGALVLEEVQRGHVDSVRAVGVVVALGVDVHAVHGRLQPQLDNRQPGLARVRRRPRQHDQLAHLVALHGPSGAALGVGAQPPQLVVARKVDRVGPPRAALRALGVKGAGDQHAANVLLAHRGADDQLVQVVQRLHLRGVHVVDGVVLRVVQHAHVLVALRLRVGRAAAGLGLLLVVGVGPQRLVHRRKAKRRPALPLDAQAGERLAAQHR